MQNPVISIVVPVYNKAKYLKDFFKCCHKLDNDPRVEIIFIDDGSTDNSLEMLSEYIKVNSIAKCYHQNNSGAGFARNFGIDKSNGVYVTFIDADDLFEVSTIKNALSKIVESKPDILFYNFRNIASDRVYPTYYHSAYKYDLLLCTTPAPWGRMFKRDFLISNNIRFNNIRTGEDMYFNCLAQCYAPRIECLNETLIIYRTVENSLSTTIDEKPLAICDSFCTILQEFKKRNFFDVYWQKNLSRYFTKYMIDELPKVNNNNKRLILTAYNSIVNNFKYTDFRITSLFGKRCVLIQKLNSLRLRKIAIFAINLIEPSKKEGNSV